MNVAWASGLFAGEGCVGVAVSRIKSGNYPYMLLQIGMYDERSIARFAETFGVNYGFVFLANRNRNFYRCNVRGRTAEKVFAKMWPFLKGTDKGDQILRVSEKLDVVDWVIGKRTDDRPQLQNQHRGRPKRES